LSITSAGRLACFSAFVQFIFIHGNSSASNG
jgi:hypothetical protein